MIYFLAMVAALVAFVKEIVILFGLEKEAKKHYEKDEDDFWCI